MSASSSLDSRVSIFAAQIWAATAYLHYYGRCYLSVPVTDLPLGAVATSYGLLKMPRMPELKKRKIVGFVADSTTRDFNDIKYK